mmetsp:Transcript_21600/g.45591  ORF Transcript_21600/g.45591 Transcript_21600/m.45591 type:complete len:252 (-) Transcript_21600:152-907(-)
MSWHRIPTNRSIDRSIGWYSVPRHSLSRCRIQSNPECNRCSKKPRRLPFRWQLSVRERRPIQVQLRTPASAASGPFPGRFSPGCAKPKNSCPLSVGGRIFFSFHRLQVEGFCKQALGKAAGLEPLGRQQGISCSAVAVRVADAQIEHGKNVASLGGFFEVVDGLHQRRRCHGLRCFSLLRVSVGLVQYAHPRFGQKQRRHTVMAVRFVRRDDRLCEQFFGLGHVEFQGRRQGLEVCIGQLYGSLGVTGIAG